MCNDRKASVQTTKDQSAPTATWLDANTPDVSFEYWWLSSKNGAGANSFPQTIL